MTKIPQNHQAAHRHSPGIVYGLIYSIFAVAFFIFFKEQFLEFSGNSETLKPLSNEWRTSVFAVISGLWIKSLLNATLIPYTVAGKKHQISVASFFKKFENIFLRAVEDEHFINHTNFIKQAAYRTSDLSLLSLHDIMKDTVTSMRTRAEINVFLLNLASTKNHAEALSLFLKNFGRRIFYHTFPQCRQRRHYGVFDFMKKPIPAHRIREIRERIRGVD